MKKYFFLILYFLQLHKLFRLINRNKTIILMYHGFTDKKNYSGIENYQGKHIDIGLFRSQIKYITKNYTVISLNDFIISCNNGRKLPRNSIIITIDDGYKSNYTLAFPIFKEFDIPATIFLTTAFVSNKDFLWVDRLEYAINKSKTKKLELNIGEDKLYFTLNSKQEKIFCDKIIRSKIKSIENVIYEEIIQQIENQLNIRLSEAPQVPSIYEPLDWNEIILMLKTSKVEIGSHAHNHLLLAKHRKKIILNELSLSKEIIERNTGVDTKLFCYPGGSFNDKTKLLLKESSYSCALTTVRGMNSEISDLYELKRFGVANTNLNSLIMDISGVKYFFSKMKMNRPKDNI